MTSSECEAKNGIPLMSPTLLTKKRGLHRPMPAKSLSDSHSGSQSISSRATSRRSKSIITTPEEQRLFERLNSSLAVLSVRSPSTTKNRLNRFQQKKEMALAPTEAPKLIHPTKQRSYQDQNTNDGSETERYFSLGGSLALDRPGKVTPIVYNLTESLSNESSSKEIETVYSSESDAFAPLPRRSSSKEMETIYSSESDAFVPLPRRNETESDEDAFTDIETNNSPDPKSSDISSGYQRLVDRENSTVDKPTHVVGEKSQSASASKSLQSPSRHDDVFSADDERSFDGGHVSVHLSVIGSSTADSKQGDRTLTLSQSTMSSTIASTIAAVDPDQSTMYQSPAGQSITDQPNQFTHGQPHEHVGSTSIPATYETGQVTTSSAGRSAVLSTDQSSGDNTSVGGSTLRYSAETSSSGRSSNSTSRSHPCDSICPSTTRSFDTGPAARSGTLRSVRSVETNFEGRGTARSVESVSGLEINRKQDSTASYTERKEEGITEEAVDEGTEEDEDPVFQPLSRSGSDISDVTTLSRAQRHAQSVPVMSYSNIFSTGSNSIWSRNENLKRDDDIFLSRAQTMLDFYESRLNADKTELTLSPGDKKKIDAKFSVSTRLRFVESLRLRCVVRNDRTQDVVQRCCRLGLDKEGARNPIFVTGTLGNRIITVEVPKPVEDDGPSGNRKNETDTSTLTTVTDSSGDISATKGAGATALGSDCFPHMCGMSLCLLDGQ